MRFLFKSLLLCVLAGCSAGPDIEIQHAWARATPPGATVAAVYAHITAKGADEIVAISSPAAARAEIHTTSESDGIMTMRPVDTVPLPSGTPVAFESGGLHIMLLDLQAPLVAGSKIPVTFTFKSAAPVTVQADIVAPGDEMTHTH
jgi:copper(I)-binding protein